MSEQETETPATPTEQAPLKKHRGSILAWVNIIFIAIIVATVNYIGCKEYTRRDLTEDQRYDISSQSINVLHSPLIKDRKTPVKVIFAFQRTTQNYTRMRSLLEEYERHADGKLDVEFIDPLRQPNRAREIAQIYGIEFDRNQVVIDGRNDTNRALKSFEGKQEGAAHVRFIPGDSFVVYEKGPDGQTMKAVALQMEDIMTAGLIGAIEGIPRKMYIISDKSNFGADRTTDENSPYSSIDRICRSLNLQLVPLRISGLKAIPDDASGLIILGTQYDLNEQERQVLSDYWNKPNAGMLIILDPKAESPKHLYRFLREQGIRPQNDRVLLKDRKRAYYEINALFAPGLDCTKDFWNSSTGLEGESISLQIENDSEQMARRRIIPFPLLMTTGEFYGETKYSQLNPNFDVAEDNPGPLMLSIALLRGNTGDVNLAKQTARMAVFGNTDILKPQQIKPEQRDFMRSIVSWITEREQLSGLGARHDLTVKLNLDRHALSALQLIANIALPALALLIALIIWKTRRH